tara:strand:- start:652 stop:1239 length:588 start_codon:yes stop_codon:yes gene_type:complete
MLKYMMFFALVGCGPTELKVEGTDTAQTVVEEEIPEQFGIINTDECDQKNIGSSVCNMVFYDQNMDVWQLYKHEGKVIVLDFSTVWCGPCQRAGQYVQPIQDDYEGDVEFVTVLVDGATGEPPTEEEINEWVASHGITTAPVLYADRSVMDQTGETGYLVGGFPTYVFIDKELKIHSGVTGFNEAYVRSIIDELL